jgi:hypothetical protein
LHFHGKPLEFSTSDVSQIAPVWRAGGFFVQEDRYLQLTADALTGLARHLNALGHAGCLHRDKWDHVNRSDSGMCAAMLPQVN